MYNAKANSAASAASPLTSEVKYRFSIDLASPKAE